MSRAGDSVRCTASRRSADLRFAPLTNRFRFTIKTDHNTPAAGIDANGVTTAGQRAAVRVIAPPRSAPLRLAHPSLGSVTIKTGTTFATSPMTAKEVYTDLLMQCTREVYQAGHMSTDYEVSWEGYKQRVKAAVQILNPSVPAVLVEMAVDAIAKEERQDDDDRLPFEP